jgi:hypothetical protein
MDRGEMAFRTYKFQTLRRLTMAPRRSKVPPPRVTKVPEDATRVRTPVLHLHLPHYFCGHLKAVSNTVHTVIRYFAFVRNKTYIPNLALNQPPNSGIVALLSVSVNYFAARPKSLNFDIFSAAQGKVLQGAKKLMLNVERTSHIYPFLSSDLPSIHFL